MVGDVAYYLRSVANSQRLRIVGHLSYLSLLLLKVSVVLHLTLNFGVFSQAAILRCVGDSRSTCNGCVAANVKKGSNRRLVDNDQAVMQKGDNIRVAVWQLVEALVGLHVQHHSALVAFETRLVPYLWGESMGEWHQGR